MGEVDYRDQRETMGKVRITRLKPISK